MARHGVGALLLAALVVWAHLRLGASPTPPLPCDQPWIAWHDAHETLHCGLGEVAASLLLCPPERPILPGDVLIPRFAGGGCQTQVHPLPAHRRLALGLPLDANQAPEDDLAALPGVGPALAGRIVGGRPYATLDDLRRVKGIGSARLATLAPRLTVGPPRLLWPSWPPPAASTLQKP